MSSEAYMTIKVEVPKGDVVVQYILRYTEADVRDRQRVKADVERAVDEVMRRVKDQA